MARPLSSIMLKGITSLRALSVRRSMTVYQHELSYSNTTGDSETHEDFRVVNKLANSGLSLQDIVEKGWVTLLGKSLYCHLVSHLSLIQMFNLGFECESNVDVKENPVMIYMKGVPDAPRCGFSALAIKVLKDYGVPISARNILEDPELKNGVKAFSNWPTFPQIFINGEFIGGSDIILNMHQNGELKEKLKDITDSTSQEKAE